ncbi:MAG TPA: hypothetical protein DEA08_09620 [Planctomycetes bacterium]|nr:hypothetical protein [Planctomycetota bacterium]
MTRLQHCVAFGGCALLAALTTAALAQEHHGGHPAPPPGHPDPHGQMVKALRELGASEAQLTQLRELHFDTQEKAIDLRASAEKAELKLHRLLLSGEGSDEAVLAAFDACAKARSASHRLHLEALLGARKILGPKLSKQALEKLHGGLLGLLHHGPHHPGSGPHGPGPHGPAPHHPQGHPHGH